jgi:hypothetical protein
LSVEHKAWKKANSWVSSNSRRYSESGKLYPRDVFSKKMILPVTSVDKFLFKIDNAMIEALKANPRNPFILFGKWLIPVKIQEADDVWHDLSENIQSGNVPYRAKISTARMNLSLGNLGRERRLICFYTPNFLWRDDVRKARIALRCFGFGSRLYYRPDILTVLEAQSVAWSDFDRGIFNHLRRHGVFKLQTKHRYYG